MKVYKETETLPLCFTPGERCEVESLASDEELSERANRYLTAKALYHQTEDPTTQKKIFEELGLYEDPVNHLRLERVYAKWHSSKVQKAIAESRLR